MTEEVSLTGELEAAAEVTASTSEETTHYYEDLVGEGKKYGVDGNEKLATAYHHAARRIEELKSDLEATNSKDELFNEVLSELRKDSGTPAIEDAPDNNAPAEQAQGADDIAKIVKGVLSAERTEASDKANTKTTLGKLTEVYGSEKDALAAVNKVVDGDTKLKGILNDLGKVNPDAAVKFVSGVVPVTTVPGSNTPGVGGAPADAIIASSGGLTWSQCRDLRKSDPKKYNSPDFRKNIEEASAAATSRGEDFFAT